MYSFRSSSFFFYSTPIAWFISYREIEKIVNFCLYAIRRKACPPIAAIRIGGFLTKVLLAFGRVLSAFGKMLPAFDDVFLVLGKLLSATGKKSLRLSTWFWKGHLEDINDRAPNSPAPALTAGTS